MTDDMERAQALEAFDRDQAIAAHRRRASSAECSVDGRCDDCDEPIEPGRLRALRGATTWCIDCATRREHQGRLGR